MITPRKSRGHLFSLLTITVGSVLVCASAFLLPLAFHFRLFIAFAFSIVIQAIMVALEGVKNALDRKASKDWMDTLTTRNALDQMAAGATSIDWKAAGTEAVEDIKTFNISETFADEVVSAKGMETALRLLAMLVQLVWYPALGFIVAMLTIIFLPGVAAFFGSV